MRLSSLSGGGGGGGEPYIFSVTMLYGMPETTAYHGNAEIHMLGHTANF